ncbi:hypothetical protein PR202_gb19087 [Eleusine coracana subsp. coracana]|uniref:Two-component response regulator n=1 Tax=Eleusine coracana subsp. coracana TaxID=191504 RepID=A0AAV5F6P1_ELECO|nr:hypothetical protein PR202_gb19087 [Eleusine coracana subsp. coracana]
MAAAAEARGGDFPVGMKVLVVDDDPTCLLVLKRMLDECKYDVTTCPQATRALTMLRENRRGFDVIISDVHMPDMDGFRLLELVGLEMDLPVIMMSADSSTNTVMKGIKHGACDYLIKPVRMEELRNIWQHVVRKKWSENKDHEHSEKETDKEEDEGDENGDPSSTSKKPRVVWSVELHQQFVNAVNHLGIDKAVPKKILELMNVPGLTRENVASHLQKFRLYLKRIAQHHAGIAHPFVPSGSSAKVAPLGGLELQALAASVMPTQSLNTFPASDGLSHNQNPLVMPPQSSSFLGAVPPSMKHEPLLATSQASSSLLGGIDLVNQASTSQPLINTHGGNLPGLMHRSSNVMSSQGISIFQGANNPYVANQTAVGVSSKPQGVLKTESTDSLRHNYGYVGGSTSMDSGLLSQSKGSQFGLLQSPDDVSGSWSSLQNIDSYGGTLGPGQSGSPSSNFRSNMALGKLSDQGRGRNHGFVGMVCWKGTCIPSRFAVDEIESPTNNLSHSIGSSVET